MNRCLLLIAASIAHTNLCYAQESTFSSSEHKHSSRIWYANNRNLEQLSEKVSSLYLNLYNGGALPVTKLVITRGDTPSELMFENNFFDGSYFPQSLDSLLCDLNPNKCKREHQIVSAPDASNPTKHISLTEANKGTWNIRPGDEILLPAINFSKFIDYVIYDLNGYESIETVVTEKTGGCTTFNEQCKEVLRSRNRLNPESLEPGYVGQITVPVLSLRANLLPKNYPKITRDDVDTLAVEEKALLTEQMQLPLSAVEQKSFDALLGSSAGKNLESSRDPNTETEKNGLQLDSGTIIDEAIRMPGGVADSVSFPPTFIPYSIPEIASENINDIRRAHNFPDWNKEDFPDDLSGQINIAAIDYKFSPDICGLQDRFFMVTREGDQEVTRVTSTECGDVQIDQNSEVQRSDHGTHVVGILGMSFAPSQYSGNPFAHILGVEMLVSDADVIEEQDALISRIRSADDDFQPLVYNFSIGYRRDQNVGGNADKLFDFIRNSENSALFVVAAGNAINGSEGANLAGGCDIRPACANLPNLITVVAAEVVGDSVTRASYSNYNDAQFHVAAVGSNVASLAPGKTLKIGSGTSQAAPHVAAAASLLLKRRPMVPARAKQRIIACSNVSNGLIGGIGGVLDVSCTIDVDRDLIIVNGNNIDGTIVGSNNSDITFSSSIGDVDIKFSEILSIGRRGDEFIVFVSDNIGGIKSRSGLFLVGEQKSQGFSYRGSGGNLEEIQLSQITRWVKRIPNM